MHTTETATDLHPAGSADSAPPRRTQRRREITRERLIAVAVELFATRGYDQTSMEIIAAEADVARTTVFNHFARKDELLRAGLAGRRDLVARGRMVAIAAHTDELATMPGTRVTLSASR